MKNKTKYRIVEHVDIDHTELPPFYTVEYRDRILFWHFWSPFGYYKGGEFTKYTFQTQESAKKYLDEIKLGRRRVVYEE